jgi:hypothetical protein
MESLGSIIWGTNCICYSCLLFFILKRKFSIEIGAIAAAYGSVSAVTFVTAVALEMQKYTFNGHMVAVMALGSTCDNHWCNFN